MLLETNTRNWKCHASFHDDVIKWKHFPRYWPFVRGIHRSPVNSPHKVQWCRALMFSLICAWINGWVNNRETGDLRRHRAHYDVSVMVRNMVVLIKLIFVMINLLLDLSNWHCRLMRCNEIFSVNWLFGYNQIQSVNCLQILWIRI